MRRFLMLLVVLHTPAAYAFPLADGAGTISTLVGVISSLIFGLLPSSAKYRKKVVAFLTCAILAFVGLVGTTLFLYSQNFQYGEGIINARQSRPEMQLNKDVLHREQLVQYKPSMEDGQFLDLHSESIKLYNEDEWKFQSKADNLELVVVGHNNEKLSDKPYSFTKFTKEQEDVAVEYVLNSTKNTVLYAHYDVYYALRISRLVHEKTGRLTPVLSIGYINQGGKIDQSKIKDFGVDLFNQNLYELRNDKNVRETHTLVNAKIFTNADFALTPAWKLQELFEGKNAVFTDYYVGYGTADYYLQQAGISDYSFVEGGLKQHFENHNLTPAYYNNRVINPELANRLFREGDSFRFICMSRTLCLDNLPKDSTYIISYRDMQREDYFAAIKALPKEYKYITVSSNQETSGLAIMTGYLLVESGHDYIGELPAFSRFSLEHIRHYIGDQYGYDTSLAEYQADTYTRYDIAKDMKAFISDSGWMILFCVFGIACRLICFPLQYKIYKSYYQDVKLGALASISGLMVPVLIVAIYLSLDGFIANYAVVPHTQVSQMFTQSYEHLKLFFIALVALQSFMSFPTRKVIAGSITALIIGVYVFGYMDLISLPMMWFLIAGEITSILLQTPIFLSYRAEVRRQKQGWALKPIKDGMQNYPEKWLLLNTSGVNSGILVRTGVTNDVYEENIRPLLANEKLIVRSSSSKHEENQLGGYFESYETTKNEAFDKIKLLNESGCDFAMIQTFFDGKSYGVASSISLDGKGISATCGEHSQATEGAAKTRTALICRESGKVINGELIADEAMLIFKTLRSLEKKLELAVAVEFCIDANGDILLLQVREQKNTAALKFFPQHVGCFTLAEDYLAKSSWVTGQLLEEVTKGEFVFVNGFIYRNNKIASKGVATIRSTQALGDNVEALMGKIDKSESNNPSYWLNALKDAVGLYSELYSASQARVTSKTVKAEYKAISANIETLDNGSEIDIHSEFKYENCQDLISMTRRDYLHHMIVLCNVVISKSICKILDVRQVPHNLNLKALLEGSDCLYTERAVYATQPLGLASNTAILSEGEVSGELWNANQATLPKEKGLVLIGEEISSQWVKNLSMFGGIVSMYGNENSHLALSARELNIPYIRVPQEQFEAIIRKGKI